MRAAQEMSEFMHDLLKQFWSGMPHKRIDLELTIDGHCYLRVEQFVTGNLYRVGYYIKSPSGPHLPDPAALFHVSEECGWIPIEITRALGGQWIVGALDPESGQLYVSGNLAQAALAAYIDLWAYNLRLQGWLERAHIRTVR